jgi:hypothetical protein
MTFIQECILSFVKAMLGGIILAFIGMVTVTIGMMAQKWWSEWREYVTSSKNVRRTNSETKIDD